MQIRGTGSERRVFCVGGADTKVPGCVCDNQQIQGEFSVFVTHSCSYFCVCSLSV